MNFLQLNGVYDDSGKQTFKVTIIKADDELITYAEDDEKRERPMIGGSEEMLWGYKEISQLNIISITKGACVSAETKKK